MINNNYIYPIIDTNEKKVICKQLKINMMDYKYEYNYIDYDYVDNPYEHASNKSIILFDKYTHDICRLMNKIMKDTIYVIKNIKFYNDEIISFQHPETKQIYEAVEDFEIRKEFCNILYHKYNNSKFEFKNNSYADIGKIKKYE
jgi:hypothetical protein